MEELEALLGADCAAVADLRTLFDLAAAYGYADWLVFDASVVRGLAYYTGEGGRGAGMRRQHATPACCAQAGALASASLVTTPRLAQLRQPNVVAPTAPGRRRV